MSSTGLEVSERRGVGANISALAGGQVVTWSMSLAWTLVVSRLLGPAGMGLLVTATSVYWQTDAPARVWTSGAPTGRPAAAAISCWLSR